MKLNTDRIEQLISSVDELIALAKQSERHHAALIKQVHPKLRPSAVNLVHYRTIRSLDLTAIQNKLGSLGISRLAQSQAHVMASLLAAKCLLTSLVQPEPPNRLKSPVSIRKSNKLLRANTRALLGYRSKGRRVRIMVTLPTEAAADPKLICSLIESGTNSVRINCAHDGPDTWLAMIHQVRKASASLRRNVKICMDLGGPKIRTGPMVSGPQVVSFGPDRDTLGRVIGPKLVWLGPPGSEALSGGHPHLPVAPEWLARIAVGDLIHFRDTRHKSRSLTVAAKSADGYWLHTFERSYVVTGTQMSLNGQDGETTEILDLPIGQECITLNTGDLLRLHRSEIPGEPSSFDESRQLQRTPHISCTNPDVFDLVKEGERILFDDGKIEAVISAVKPGEELLITVTRTSPTGQKLRADKGINLPDSRLTMSGLTDKDRQDLEFIVEHADVVNMSFVNTVSDVQDLLTELDRLGALGKTGVILKVETQSGFENLTEIVLTAMQTYPIGVMIARGDLAVECGWENIPRIQQEIQSLCNAAHLPDVWATQVLENMAKKGLPSRAELTDAATAVGAECVMLNKGPHISAAVRMLDSIFKDLRAYRHDKLPMLPALKGNRGT